MKYVIVAALVVIVAALASAGVFMVRGGRDGDAAKQNRMVRALTVRIGVSIALFVFILVAWQLGWIEPTGLPVGR